jgi:hypothetical protein
MAFDLRSLEIAKRVMHPMVTGNERGLHRGWQFGRLAKGRDEDGLKFSMEPARSVLKPFI